MRRITALHTVPSSADPVGKHLEINVYVYNFIDSDQPVERFCLVYVAGKTVEHKIDFSGVFERDLYYFKRDFVGNELTFFDIRPCKIADIRLLTHMMTENVSRRNMLYPVIFFYPERLGAFAGTRCAQKYDVHDIPPSIASLLFKETLVLSHKQLIVKLFLEFERDADHDEHTCGSERVGKRRRESERHTEYREQYARYDEYDRKVYGAEQRKTFAYFVEVFGGRFTRSYSGNESAVLLKITRYLIGLELYHRIEVAEEQYQKSGDHEVYRSTGTDVSYPPVIRRTDHLHDELRESDDGSCEDYGEHAGRVNFNGNMRVLTAVLLSAFYLLCVRYGDFALRTVYERDESENEYHHGKEDKQEPGLLFVAVAYPQSERLDDSKTCGGNDTHEDKERYTVTDTEIGELFAQPHREYRAAHKHRSYKQTYDDVGYAQTEHSRADISRAMEAENDTYRLHHRKKHRKHSRERRHLALAFVALLRPSFDRRYGDRKQLRYNGSVDVGRDTERKQRAVL